MADDSTIIEGCVKFRDGKKWKSRWCVMRKLSPVADCVQLQLWRDARARCAAGAGAGAGARCKAALSLQQFAGAEAGFTLDKQSNTLALLCRDLVAVLAFDTRERLMQWQVKVHSHLGQARQYLVVVGARDAGRLPPGPARLHLLGARAALAAGAPPRLLGHWEIRHLRRYGVVEGRFCFEGGALCGAGEGLHVLVSEHAHDLARDFENAARGHAPQRRSAPGGVARPGYESPDAFEAEDEPRPEAGAGDTASLRGARAADGRQAALQRCVSCMSKLGALSRSTTGALTPGDFSPAWTMDARDACACGAAVPARPSRPAPASAGCVCARPALDDSAYSRVGPYENYDVPRVPSTEVEGEYYDTPRRLRECLDDAAGGAAEGVVVRSACGCVLRVARRRGEPVPAVLDAADEPAPRRACRRVTDWAQHWIRLPYCGRSASAAGEENVTPEDARDALYATVDVSRKVRRTAPARSRTTALANYENLNFALSLEHYENAKALLRRAGASRAELLALQAASLGDDYLPMAPGAPGRPRGVPASGYTPMSPVGNFTAHAPALSAHASDGARALDEKSASNPALRAAPGTPRGGEVHARARRSARRSRSADSTHFLDDGAASPGARGSASSLETLRDVAPPAPAPAAGARDSSSSNDSGVSSCSPRPPPERARFELPLTTCAARRRYRSARGAGPEGTTPCREGDACAARRALSAGAVAGADRAVETEDDEEARRYKSCSAEAEVPLLNVRSLRGGCAVGCSAAGAGALDAHSTSSGTSDMSDYIETLSLCSSHSSADAPLAPRACRQPTSALRPRSGAEYQRLAPRARAAPPPPPSHGRLCAELY